MRDRRASHEFTTHVIRRVIAYRAEHGLSQTGLARLTDMEQPQICRLETGRHTPTFEMLARLTQAPGLEFDIHVADGCMWLEED